MTRSQSDIRTFLNIVLDHTISDFFVKGNAKKRNPEGGLVSLEEMVGERDEEDLPAKLKQYFVERLDEKKEMYTKIGLALSRLRMRNPKMADIIKKRYKFGKTLQEIGDDYGNTTRQNIEKLEKKALKIIRNIINGRIKSDLSIPQERSIRRFRERYKLKK